jgi:hypothetical protein
MPDLSALNPIFLSSPSTRWMVELLPELLRSREVSKREKASTWTLGIKFVMLLQKEF